LFSAVGGAIGSTVTFFFWIHMTVAAVRGTFAICCATAVGTRVEQFPQVALFPLVEDAITAVRWPVGAAYAAMVVLAVVQKVTKIAHFSEVSLNDAITASGELAFVRTSIIVDLIAIIAFLSAFIINETITTS
jgi:hypothetical protein